MAREKTLRLHPDCSWKNVNVYHWIKVGFCHIYLFAVLLADLESRSSCASPVLIQTTRQESGAAILRSALTALSLS